jgi:hypothetical protein
MLLVQVQSAYTIVQRSSAKSCAALSALLTIRSITEFEVLETDKSIQGITIECC